MYKNAQTVQWLQFIIYKHPKQFWLINYCENPQFADFSLYYAIEHSGVTQIKIWNTVE
jgi:hypothetical protein